MDHQNVIEYHESCSNFLKDANFETILNLSQSLARVPPDYIDISEAESLVRHLTPYLESLDGDNVMISLYSCLIVVRFQVKKPSNMWVNSIDVTAKTARIFRDLVAHFMHNGTNVTLLAELIDLWTQLVNMGKVEEEFEYLLLISSLKWIFNVPPESTANEYSLVSRRFITFTSSLFLQFDEAGRERILHDTLSTWFQNSEKLSYLMVDLVLSLIAASGKVSMMVWKEATVLKSRQELDSQASLAHQSAVGAATLISRRIIDWSWPLARTNTSRRTSVQSFIEESASRVKSPQWPTAELFISCFLTCLFKLSGVIRNQKYPIFLMDSLRAIQSKILIEKTEGSVVEVVKQAISSCTNPEQALYLATRQLEATDQPYQQFYLSLNSKTDDEVENWNVYLNQWPIASYYSQINDVLKELALREDLKDAHQIELFKLMEGIRIFDIRWLDRLRYAIPLVCECLVPLVTMDFQQRKDLIPIQKLCSRVAAPGAPGFKKRVMQLLSSVRAEADTPEANTIAWKYALIAAGDSEISVQVAGLRLCEELFTIFDENRHAFAEALKTTDKILLQRGLKSFVNHFVTSNGRQKIQMLIKHLITEKKLDLAAAFIEVDGTFMPISEIPDLFNIGILETDPRHLVALQILDNAFNTRPRIIIGPTQISNMFETMCKRLKWFSERDINHVGSILKQLSSLDTKKAQDHRLTILNEISKKAFSAVKSSINPFKKTIFNQSLIISGCIRFWCEDIKVLRSFCLDLVDIYSREGLPTESSLLIIRTVFSVCSKHCLLFGDPILEKFFNSFDIGGEEADCLTKLLLIHMNSTSVQSLKSDANNTPLSGLKKGKVFGIKSEASEDANTAASLMLQKHLSRLIELIKTKQDVNALRVVVKALDDNLIVADECIPTIVALCFSPRPEISQTALKSFQSLCEKSPRNFGIKFVEGLKLVNPEDSNMKPFPAMWYVYKDSRPQKNIKQMLEYLAKILNFIMPLGILKLLISALTEVEMATKDANQLILAMEDGLNRFEPEKHSKSNSISMILVHVLAYWLRRRYGLSEYNKVSKFGSKGEDPDIETINCEAIIERFDNDENDVINSLRALWKLPDYYGTKKMNELIYGYSKKRLGNFNYSPEAKRRS